MTTTTLRLTAAVRSHGGALPLLSGDIAMDELQLDQIKVEPQIAAYRRMVRDLAFDVCEHFTTYLCAKAFNKQFTAIPVFLTRDFHHRSVVCNVASGIKEPKDLIGKKFGVRAYTVTTGVWTRGILESEYGVDPAQVTWYTDDEEHVTEWVRRRTWCTCHRGEPGCNDRCRSAGRGLERRGGHRAQRTPNGQLGGRRGPGSGCAHRGPTRTAVPQARVRGGVVPADGDFSDPRPHCDQERSARGAPLGRGGAAARLPGVKGTPPGTSPEAGPSTADDRLILENQELIGGGDPLHPWASKRTARP